MKNYYKLKKKMFYNIKNTYLLIFFIEFIYYNIRKIFHNLYFIFIFKTKKNNIKNIKSFKS